MDKFRAMENVVWVECPRDAMQGISRFIPTEEKSRYLNALLQAGFEVLDFGSFVSPKAIPQMQDSPEVLKSLNLTGTCTRLLAIVANMRGVEAAISFPQISYLGYPLSVSETFQMRNTNSTIEEALVTVKSMMQSVEQCGKEAVVYLSMAFGNPYGDAWNTDILLRKVDDLAGLGVRTIALADTVGLADPRVVYQLFNRLVPALPEITFGAHLHCTPHNWRDKLQAAWDGGCRRFDSAMKGFGGCPMANDELVGNLASENLLAFFKEKNAALKIDSEKFQTALQIAGEIFRK